MALVAPVNLPYNIKTLWFEPGSLELAAHEKVVVQTARGQELGVMASDVREVTDEEIEALKSPLMPVLRVASDEDIERAKEMERKSHDALDVFKRLARETNEDMHPVSVEFMLDGEKAVFYFESEERIDFRELVRKLASEFHVRIDMRQIGVRDEARIVGGIAHCGQVVCCKRLGGEFKPVSIRMAKEQDMSLNPQKISGLCGRLMCCLRYETELYSEFKKTAPKIGAEISTPAGVGKVTEIDVPKETISVKIDDEKPVKVPVSMIEGMSEDRKAARVSDESWESLMEDVQSAMFEHGGLFNLPKFTTEDKLASAKAVHHERSDSKSAGNQSRTSGSSRASTSDDSRKGSNSTHKPRGSKRRSVKIALGGNGESANSNKKGEKEAKSKGGAKQSQTRGKKSGSVQKKSKQNRSNNSNHGNLRPGHKSSGLAQNSGEHAQKSASGQNVSSGSSSGNRRRRRRSHKAQGSGQTGNNGQSSSGKSSQSN